MNEITIAPESAIVIDQHLAFLAELTKQKADNARAANTLDSYESDWNDFKEWCAQKNLSSLPADPCTVAVYLTDRSEHSWRGPSGRLREIIEKPPINLRTLERRKASIIYYHKKMPCNLIQSILFLSTF